MKILLLRHAESIGNSTGDYSTAIHDNLSEKGRGQAENVAQKLLARPIDKVIASPLSRALQTVEPYLRRKGGSAEIWPEFAEACWQPRQLAPSASSWPEDECALAPEQETLFRFRDGRRVRPAERESFQEGLFRVRQAYELLLTEAAKASPPAFCLVVTHGHAIREFLNIFCETSQTVDFPHKNCALTLLSWETGVKSVLFMNE